MMLYRFSFQATFYFSSGPYFQQQTNNPLGLIKIYTEKSSENVKLHLTTNEVLCCSPQKIRHFILVSVERTIFI